MKPGAKRLLGILASLLLFIGAMVIYSSMVLPKYKEIQELRGEKIAKSNMLQEEGASVAAVERLLEQYESVSDLQKTISLTLPMEEDVASVFNQIRGIATSNEVLLNSLSISPLSVMMSDEADVSLVKPMGSLRILVDLTGGYDALKAFLGAIETNIRIMDVNSVSISDGGTNGPYQYQVEIDTYYQI